MSVTKNWVSGQLSELRVEMRQLFAEQNEKFAQLLVNHFYTKDEIDGKLSHYATKEDLRNSHETLKSYIGVQVESLRSDFRAGLEAIGFHSQKLDNHEVRIQNLENKTY